MSCRSDGEQIHESPYTYLKTSDQFCNICRGDLTECKKPTAHFEKQNLHRHKHFAFQNACVTFSSSSSYDTSHEVSWKFFLLKKIKRNSSIFTPFNTCSHQHYQKQPCLASPRVDPYSDNACDLRLYPYPTLVINNTNLPFPFYSSLLLCLQSSRV